MVINNKLLKMDLTIYNIYIYKECNITHYD